MKTLTILLLSILLLVLSFEAGVASQRYRIPLCPEDAVLIGVGEFEHRVWTAYVCGPAVDDYLGD